jgi:multiple sugar transport system ATP-binding protein
MATVTFDHLYKRYGEEVVAVNDLNLEIDDGEFLCLVGPSGCGKTTALRCVAGLEEISEGRLLIGERTVNDVPPKDRDIAMVFQSYALYPHMSVYDNLAFGLKLRKVRKEEIDRRVKEGAKILGLERFLDRKPKALSGGQRQRVALGRAIVREPSVFLMDEPLSNLDAKLRVQTRAEIARLHQRLGTTTIYVTHDQVEAMTMGDRIAVMKDGLLQQVGTPQELYDHPNNVFVAGFIGSPAMNFATVKATEGGDLMLGNAQLHLSGDPARAAEQQPKGKDLLIGFRPEHLEVANGRAGDGAMQIPAKVDVVEYLGNEELIHAQAEGHEVVALISSDQRVKVGDEVNFAVPMDKLHIFDPESEKTLVG